jgi:hypothetical protein
LGAQAVGVHTK